MHVIVVGTKCQGFIPLEYVQPPFAKVLASRVNTRTVCFQRVIGIKVVTLQNPRFDDQNLPIVFLVWFSDFFDLWRISHCLQNVLSTFFVPQPQTLAHLHKSNTGLLLFLELFKFCFPWRRQRRGVC